MPDELTSSVYGSAQTWYPETSGYFILIVRDNAGGRTARYRIYCNIGERHSNGINYRIYYKMYLIGGDELGITLEDREYYTRHDNATSEIGAREYHLPVTFRLFLILLLLILLFFQILPTQFLLPFPHLSSEYCTDS